MRPLVAVLFVACTTACTPFAPTPPFHIMESARTLQRGELSVAAAGGGAVKSQMWAAGGAARARWGLGARQEMGLEGTMAYAHWEAASVSSGNSINTSTGGAVYGGKVSWKGGLADWVALLGGAGFGHADFGTSIGGDIGAVVSFPHALRSLWIPYGGLRMGLGVPVEGNRKSTITLSMAGGTELLLGSSLQLAAEAGWLNAWGGSAEKEYSWQNAFYGGLGLTYVVPKPASPAELHCPDGVAQIAPAGPWAVSLDGSVGIGLFFATHGGVELGLARRLGQRFELSLQAGVGGGDDLVAATTAAGAGILLHPAARLDLLLYWRLGWAHFRTSRFEPPVDADTLLLSVGIELRLPLARRWELRLAPIALTGYWKELWGAVLQPRLGMAWRF